VTPTPAAGPTPLSPRLLAAGLAVGTFLAALIIGGGSERLLSDSSRRAAERLAVVVAQGAAAVAEQASVAPATAGHDDAPAAAASEPTATSAPPSEEATPAFDPTARVTAALTAWHREQPAVRAVRVIRDRNLDFSTAEVDLAQGATPRRLVREEKPYFDQLQRIAAAVNENRQGETAPREEIEVERLDHGHLRVAAPFTATPDSLGVVQLELAPGDLLAARPSRSGLPLALALALGAGGLGWAIGRALATRRVVAIGLAVVTLLGAVAWLTGSARSVATEFLRERGETIGQLAADQARRAGQALATVGVTRALTAPELDVDRMRQPLGRLDADGTPLASAGAPEQSLVSARATRWLTSGGALGLLALLAFALGWMSRAAAAAHKYRVAYAYTVPAMLGMLVLVFFPFLYGLTLSFTSSNIYNSDQGVVQNWVGLENFVSILTDFQVASRGDDGELVWNYRNFYWTLLFTVVWTVTNVTIGVTVGLALALVLNTPGLKGKALYRVLLILPWAVPNYITALIWKGMFHQQFGVINQILQIVGLDPVSWFEKPLTSFATVLATNGWLSFPFMMVISLGALQSIPGDLYEAARVDGATKWQQFRFITLPSLKPALVPAIILSVIWTFNMFNIIYLVSQGEPAGSTEILITQAYKLAFEQYRYGYAAAYSTVIFFILLAYGWWQNRVTKASEGA
jgi:arabinogalactan oligomer/maltooligosaccharide transport system permease protein